MKNDLRQAQAREPIYSYRVLRDAYCVKKSKTPFDKLRAGIQIKAEYRIRQPVVSISKEKLATIYFAALYLSAFVA